jgi:antitoxin YefM
MDAITYSSARQNMATTMDSVCDDHSPIIITRKNKRSVVMLSLEEYNSLTETAYLLRSPKNAVRIFEAISELEDGDGIERKLLK